MISATTDRKRRFAEIYTGHEWGGHSLSGPGSDERSTVPYVKFVQYWLDSHPEAKTVVELGCGDWATSSRIEWGDDRRYIGLDIVDDLIEKNRDSFASKNVSFMAADFVDDDLPTGDVLIAKDVLQHLSNESVLSLLKRTKNAFQYCIFVNDCKKILNYKKFFIPLRKTLGQPNRDMEDGGSRPLLLTEFPFLCDAVESMQYDTYITSKYGTAVYTKELLVIRNK